MTAYAQEAKKKCPFTQKNAKATSQDGYPLEVCPVSGEKLGTMGKPYIFKHEGREVRLCCQGCLDTFKKDPEKYLKKMDQTCIDNQKEIYPFTACVVSGKKFADQKEAPYDFLYGRQLVRLASKDYLDEFNKNPEQYVKKIQESMKRPNCTMKGTKQDAAQCSKSKKGCCASSEKAAAQCSKSKKGCCASSEKAAAKCPKSKKGCCASFKKAAAKDQAKDTKE